MTVKVILKQPAPNGMKEFEFNEQGILDDKEAGRVILALGVLSGGRINEPHYTLKESMHLAYDWNDIERLEVTP